MRRRICWKPLESRRVVAERRFTEHALRPQVVGEMQLRREPALTVPARMIQLVRLLDADARTAELLSLIHI